MVLASKRKVIDRETFLVLISTSIRWYIDRKLDTTESNEERDGTIDNAERYVSVASIDTYFSNRRSVRQLKYHKRSVEHFRFDATYSLCVSTMYHDCGFCNPKMVQGRSKNSSHVQISGIFAVYLLSFSSLYAFPLFRTNFSSPYRNVIRQNAILADARLSVFWLFPSTRLFKFLPRSAMVRRSMLLATSLEKRKRVAQTTLLDVLETRRIASCHRTYEAIHTFPSSRPNIQRDKNIEDTVRD